MSALTAEQKAQRASARDANQLRDAQAFALKVGGATLSQIAAELGWKTPSGAMLAINRHLAFNAPAHERETARALQLERIDRVILTLYPLATRTVAPGPDYDALDRMLRYLQHQARLLGLQHDPQLDADRFYEEVRKAARDEGLDEEDAVREAEAVLARHGRKLR